MATHHSSHARHSGKTTPTAAAKPHMVGSKKGNIDTKPGQTMAGPADRYPGATGQMGVSG